MLTDAKLRSQIDSLWDRLWTGGLNNPMDAIEQLSFLLFLKRLDDEEDQAQRQAANRGVAYTQRVPDEMRWRSWKGKTGGEMLAHVRDKVFPWFRTLGTDGSSFALYMQNAEFKISKATLLIEACNAIDAMQISQQNQDVQGDLYEYLLSRLNVAGRNGQFRTPRHIVRMMVQMVDPKPGERIADLAAGTCGFLVNAYQYILERHTSPEILAYDADGWPHNLIGDRLSQEQRAHLQTKALRGYDNDAGMTMLRIGSMNLMLHGVMHPQFFYMDTLSKAFAERRAYEVVLMNPPFKGAVDKNDVSDALPSNTTKSELLFLHLILRTLEMGGRCAVIVPDGVLFGSSNAHVEIRRKLVEENRLEGVVSMPGGVFKPYAGVSTAVLFFTRGASTERIWFYDMEHDGFSLDDKRQPTVENDIPDILEAWRRRADGEFGATRAHRLAELRTALAPLKAERLALHAENNRLIFEGAIGDESHDHTLLDAANAHLAALEGKIAPLQAEANRLSRQFWVSREEVKANKYDLSASRYRQIEQDEVYYEEPQMTIKRMMQLETVFSESLLQLSELLS